MSSNKQGYIFSSFLEGFCDNILNSNIDLKTTVGHTGSNACGEDKVHVFPIKEKQVVFREAGKRITILCN